jgi:hypothetical protein
MWSKPELGFTVRVRNVDMDTLFLTGEEEKPELTFAENGRSHVRTLHWGAASPPLGTRIPAQYDRHIQATTGTVMR